MWSWSLPKTIKIPGMILQHVPEANCTYIASFTKAMIRSHNFDKDKKLPFERYTQKKTNSIGK